MTTLSQPEIWERLAGHAGKFRRIALKNNVPPYDADDVVHNSMIRASEKIDTLRDVSKFEQWANSIAHNQAMEYHRKKIRESKTLISLDQVSEERREREEAGLTGGSFFTEEEVRHIKPEVLKEAMAALSPNEEMIFRLHVQKGYGHKDIAAMTEISYNNVRVVYCRAKDKLEHYLTSHQEEEEEYEKIKR